MRVGSSRGSRSRLRRWRLGDAPERKLIWVAGGLGRHWHLAGAGLPLLDHPSGQPTTGVDQPPALPPSRRRGAPPWGLLAGLPLDLGRGHRRPHAGLPGKRLRRYPPQPGPSAGPDCAGRVGASAAPRGPTTSRGHVLHPCPIYVMSLGIGDDLVDGRITSCHVRMRKLAGSLVHSGGC